MNAKLDPKAELRRMCEYYLHLVHTTDPAHQEFLDSGADTIQLMLDFEAHVRWVLGQLEGSKAQVATQACCPSCGCKTPRNYWSNPSCPKCLHGNAMLSGVCRDCGFTDVERYQHVVEYHCNCGARYLVSTQSKGDSGCQGG